MAIEDFGGSSGQAIELVVADPQNKSDIAFRDRAQMVRRRKVDMIANLINSSIALGVTQLAKDKDRIAIVNGSGSSRLTGDGCTPNSIHYAYDTYSLAKGTGTAMMKAGERAVFPHRGLCVWPCARSRYNRRHQGARRSGVRLDALSGRDFGSILVPAAGASVEGKVVGLAGSGTVFVNAVKAAQEFGIQRSGQTLAVFWSGSPTSRAWGLMWRRA